MCTYIRFLICCLEVKLTPKYSGLDNLVGFYAKMGGREGTTANQRTIMKLVKRSHFFLPDLSSPL
jgi:hypothetical protein